MDSANTENQHSNFALNQQRRNCFNITVFFQRDKCNGNVTETKSFPFMYLISFSNTSSSLYCLCALPACFPKMFAPHPFQEGLLTPWISLTVLSAPLPFPEKTAVCCLHNPEQLHRFYSVVCYRTLLAALQVSVSRVKPPTTSSKTLPHDLCPPGLSVEAKSLLNILDESSSLK